VTSAPSTPHDALLRRLARDPASPLITYYDDATGERVELSTVSFANWVFKAANLLRDDLGLEADGTIGVHLPVHWQTFVVIHAAWHLGATVTPLAALDQVDSLGLDVLVRHTDDPSAGDRAAADVIALGLRPMAVPGAPVSAPVIDFDREVRVHADAFSGPRIDPASPALTTQDVALTHGQLNDRAQQRDLPESARLTIEVDRAASAVDLSAVIEAGLVALMRDRGLVISVGAADPEVRAQRLVAERSVPWITLHR
jgi:uncharacterized protein (TIGR03089 family)